MSTNPPRSRLAAPAGYVVESGRPKPREIARARRKRRERRYRNIALVVLLLAAGLVAAGVARAHLTGTGSHGASHRSGPNSASPPPASDDPTPGNYPSSGPGTFNYAAGTGPMLGSAGSLRRFKVAVEDGTGQRADDLASVADQVLGDARGWTAGATVRFQRVPQNSTAEFTLYLATAGTSEQMCAKGSLHTGGYVSCRLPGQVILNLSRWLGGVPNYGAPLASYRRFALNHEVGRELGYGNESCPGAGQPAPVMQQQTLGLAGCVANSWPYLGGKLYQGNPIP
jgi:hypothetical protein